MYGLATRILFARCVDRVTEEERIESVLKLMEAAGNDLGTMRTETGLTIIVASSKEAGDAIYELTNHLIKRKQETGRYRK